MTVHVFCCPTCGSPVGGSVAVLAFAKSLSRQRRAIFEAIYYGPSSGVPIAKIIGVTHPATKTPDSAIGSVKVQISRLRQELRAIGLTISKPSRWDQAYRVVAVTR